ncbi:MAG: hypothetical protein IJ454_04775 [Clostridia bacterium]|nr:hypothetical protein [Clostridia bacterium]
MTKRILSIILCICTVSCLCAVPAFAETPEILFDMDITDFDPEATTPERGIINSVAETGSATGIELAGGTRTINGSAVTSGYFSKDTYINAKDEEIPHIDIKQQQYSNTASTTPAQARIFIDNPDWTGKSYTAEMWVKPSFGSRSDAGENYAPIAYLYGGQQDTRTNTLSDKVTFGRFNKVDMYWFGISDTSRKTISGAEDGWMHLVITRNVADGSASHVAYVNGVKQLSTNAATTAATEGRAGLALGGLNYKAYYICQTLSIADVKVYDGILTDDDIALKFAERRSDFDIEAPNSVAAIEENIAPDAVSFGVTMAKAMDAAELSKLAMKRKKDGAIVEASFASDGTTLTVTPKEYLSYDTEYILDFSPLYCEDYEFATMSADVSFAYDPSVSEDAISFELATERSTGTVTVIAVGIDAQGVLCGAASALVDLSAAKTGTIEETGMAGWNTVKLMIWENGDGYTMPLTEVIEIN